MDAGVGLAVMDYRGYGRSTGTPTITAMMKMQHMQKKGTAMTMKKQTSLTRRSLSGVAAIALASLASACGSGAMQWTA